MDRRHFLSAAGGVLVSGCFAGGTADTASPTVRGPSTGSADHLGDLILWNDDDEQHTLSVTVEGGGDVFRDTNRTLSPGSSGGVSNRIDRQGEYRIVASLEDGTQNSTVWQITSCHSFEYLQIYISAEREIEFRTKHRTVVPTPTC